MTTCTCVRVIHFIIKRYRMRLRVCFFADLKRPKHPFTKRFVVSSLGVEHWGCCHMGVWTIGGCGYWVYGHWRV